PTGILIASTADGTGSLIHTTTGVEATVERYLPAAGYHLVSVPFTQSSNPFSGWFIWSYLYNFDVSTQAWVAMGSPTGTPLNVDQGYMVYKYPGPAKWSADTTYAMTGFMNSGSFMCAVSGGAQDHNLVPNPYPSAIDWDAAAGWTKSDIYNAIWIWNNNGNYAAYVNGIAANNGSQYIPVGQAFFIQASGASAGLTMNNDVRVHNDQPFFKDAEEQLNVLRIKAKSNNYQDEIVVYFNGEASTAFDGQFDASKMFGLPEAPQIYSVSTDNRNLTINGMPFSSEVISIPVGFSLETAGEVTFEASSIESFDPEVTIFLWDMLTNTMINLRENQQYSFVHNPDNDPVRFALLFNSAVGIAESATNPVRLYATDNKLYLHIPEEIDEDFLVQLYDTGGRMIFSTTASTGSTIINVPSLGAGIYIVQLVSDQHSVVKKVFMK
ncbi:MAG TPA: T9SS type A sorting domain-containing protein, partial [Bacteroidales bacterium]|nr:T9SS type A sorting domain-containing protein [Bacteroidales bacterium]